MSILAAIAIVGLGVLAALSLVRVFMGPTLYDRALAAQSVVVKMALMCAALALLQTAPAWIDAAFALLLGAFVCGAAVLKFFRLRSFQAPLAFDEGQG